MSASRVPRVSVCIPTYNMASFLGECIASVLAQTIDDVEVIVCDNRSTDATNEVVERFKDERIRFFVNERNLGLFGNFNRTIAHARGEYVKFLCADDRLDARYLERALALFQAHPTVGIVTALHTWIDVDGRVIARHAPARLAGPVVVPADEMHRRAPWHHNEIGTPSHAMVRREALERVGGFDLAYEIAADWELWVRIFGAYGAGFLRDYLVEIRIHSTQQSVAAGASLRSARDSFRLAARHYEGERWQRSALAVRVGEVYLWEGVMRCARGEWRDGWALVALVVRKAPRALLALYVLGHLPLWIRRGIRRRYAFATGKVWET